MPEIIKIKNDIMFKMLMCSEKREDNLKVFLQKIYNKNIKEIKYQPILLNEKYLKTRNKYVDCLVTLDSGEVIVIEINTTVKKYLNRRNSSYIANRYTNSINHNESYLSIPKHVLINFTWGLGIKEKEESHYYMQNENKKTYIDNLEIIEYNMDKIMNEYYTKNEEKIKRYKHIMMLDLKPEEIIKISEDEEYMKKIAKEVEDLNKDKDFIEFFSPEKEAIITRNSEYEEGIEDGTLQKTYDSAINLFKKKINKQIICECLEISQDELEKILIDAKLNIS